MTGWADVSRLAAIYAAFVLTLAVGAVVVVFAASLARRLKRRPGAPTPGPGQTNPARPQADQRSHGAVIDARPRRRVAGAVSVSSAHAAVSADVAIAPGVRALAASVVGRDHLARALSREDAYCFHRLPDRAGPGMCFAVTDGVSGAPRSQIYSLALAQAAAQTLADVWPNPPLDLLPRVAHRTAEISQSLVALGADAVPAKSQERTGSAAATLALVAGVPTATGLEVTWWQVGDARIGVLDPTTGTLTWISGPGGGDGHLTHAMPGNAGEGGSGRGHVPVGQWLVLASDGAIPVLESLPHVALAAVRGRRDDLTVLAALTDLLGATVDGEHDDRTVLLLTSDATV